jgi:hypothetical protein
MTWKHWTLIAGLVLAVAYACLFTGWFKPKTIEIYHTLRPAGYVMQNRRDVPATLSFGLGGRFQLTEIKVVSLTEWQTNHGVPPVWHLVSDSNSVPLNVFSYGQRIRGMKPAVAGARAQPLGTNVAYRLFVTADKIKGQHDFEIGSSLPGAK